MKWSGTQIEKLHQALLSAFPEVSDLRMFVRMNLNERLAAITGGSKYREVVFSLIEWAEAEGRLEELVQKAAAANSGNPDLQDIAAHYLADEARREAKIQAYLRWFLAKIEGRLDAILALAALDTPSAVEDDPEILQYITLPPSLAGKSDQSSETSSSRTFDNFSDAYAALGQRILLLGAPGSGKTTTLLQFACKAARERQQSPEKPLPIFVSLHRWDHKTSLVEWTHAALSPFLHGVHLENSSLLYIFDGLDELGGERPVDIQQLDGEKYDPRLIFLKAMAEQLPDALIIVSCREQDYQQIGKKAMLEGAVTLLPLEPTQVHSFLSRRNQSTLWSALIDDLNLLDLVRTPLLLTLLSLATGEEGSMHGLNVLHMNDTSIFDFYIKQRFVHEASKRVLPFDEHNTRILLGRLAASMMTSWYATELHVSKNKKLTAQKVREFVEFACTMHFMQMSSSHAVKFIHLKFRDYCAVPALIEALKASDNEIRWHAANALGGIGDARAVPALVEALKDTTAFVRHSAANALRKTGAISIPALIEALKVQDTEACCNAVEVLGDIGDVKAAVALIEALKASDNEIRWHAANALGGIGDARAVPALVEALKDTTAFVRCNAANALGKIKDARAVPALIVIFNDTDLEVRQSAANALREIGKASIPALLMSLKHEEFYVRLRAIRILREIGDISAVPGLIAVLQDSDQHVRQGAARALCKISKFATVPALVEVLRDTNKKVRQLAIREIEWLRTAPDPTLIAALKEPIDY